MKTAYEFILSNPKIIYPLDPLIFFRGRMNALPWSEARRFDRYAEFFDFIKTRAEARTQRIRGTDSYLTIYDDSIKYRERLKFTFAHELGHIICGHLDDYENTALNRGGLTQREYRVLEDEADFFAGQLIAPVPLLFLTGLTDEKNIPDIKRIFEISWSAAEKRHIDIINPARARLYEEYKPKFESAFKNRLDLYKNGYNCIKCGRIVNRKISFCAACGGSGFIKSNNLNTAENDSQLDNTRACPRCGGEPVNEAYCVICGLFLTHLCKCGNEYPVDARFCVECGEKTGMDFKPACVNAKKYPFRLRNCPVCGEKDLRTNGQCLICGAPLYNICINCRKNLPGNARYCGKCGAESSFFYEKLLDEWYDSDY